MHLNLADLLAQINNHNNQTKILQEVIMDKLEAKLNTQEHNNKEAKCRGDKDSCLEDKCP